MPVDCYRVAHKNIPRNFTIPIQILIITSRYRGWFFNPALKLLYETESRYDQWTKGDHLKS